MMDLQQVPEVQSVEIKLVITNATIFHILAMSGSFDDNSLKCSFRSVLSKMSSNYIHRKDEKIENIFKRTFPKGHFSMYSI
jgi:hypothetical protein